LPDLATNALIVFVFISDNFDQPRSKGHRLGGGVLGALGALGGAGAEAVAELAGDELQ